MSLVIGLIAVAREPTQEELREAQGLLVQIENQAQKQKTSDRYQLRRNLEWCGYCYGTLCAIQKVAPDEAQTVAFMVLTTNLRRRGAPDPNSVQILAAELKDKYPKIYQAFVEEKKVVLPQIE